MSPEQSQTLAAEIEDASRRARTLVEGLDVTSLTRRPSLASWSIAECLQHLVITSRSMRPLIEAALSEVERKGARSAAPSGLGFLGWMLVKMLEPPARFKTKTTPSFVPVQVPDPMQVAATLCEENNLLIALARRGTGLNTASTTIVSPFNAAAKYNAYAAFRITAVHLRRHIWQAEQARAPIAA